MKAGEMALTRINMRRVQQAYGGSTKAPVILCENTILTAAYTNLAPKRPGFIIVDVNFNVAYDVYIEGLEMRLCQLVPSGDVCTPWMTNTGNTVFVDIFNGNEAMYSFYVQSRVNNPNTILRDVCKPVLSPGDNYSSVGVTYEYVLDQ